MKKSLLTLVALAALGLTACGGKNDKEEPTPGPGPTPTPGPTVDVPEEEGKYTLYFTLGDESVALPDYGSYFLTGGAIGFATGFDALEMQQLGESKVYYVQVAMDSFDVSANQGTEYQLLQGYNATSGMPAAKMGLQWDDTMKSNVCKELGGLNNPSFEVVEGKKAIDLGTHSFDKALPKPTAPLKNYTFVVEFEEAIPEYGTVLIFGSFNGWNTPGDGKDNEAVCAEATMTPNEDRTIWKLTFEEMIAGDYLCKILVEYKADVESTHNVTWNTVEETPENYAFTVTQADGDGYELDILGLPAHYSLPDPTATIPFTIIVANNGGELAAEKLYICGGFTSWAHVELEKDGENYKWEGDLTAGKKEFGVMSKTDWSDKAVGEGGANAAFTLSILGHASGSVTFTCDFAKFGIEAQAGVVGEVQYK